MLERVWGWLGAVGCLVSECGAVYWQPTGLMGNVGAGLGLYVGAGLGQYVGHLQVL